MVRKEGLARGRVGEPDTGRGPVEIVGQDVPKRAAGSDEAIPVATEAKTLGARPLVLVEALPVGVVLLLGSRQMHFPDVYDAHRSLIGSDSPTDRARSSEA